jgi:hypothetical protein
MSDESHIGFNPLKNQGNNVKNEYYASYKKAHPVGFIKRNEDSKPHRYRAINTEIIMPFLGRFANR